MTHSYYSQFHNKPHLYLILHVHIKLVLASPGLYEDFTGL